MLSAHILRGDTVITSATNMSTPGQLGTDNVVISNNATLGLNFSGFFQDETATFGTVTINSGSLSDGGSALSVTRVDSALLINGSATLRNDISALRTLRMDGLLQINTGGALTASVSNSNNISLGGVAATITLAAGSTFATTGTGTVRFGDGAARTIVGQGTATQEARLVLGAATHTADAGTKFQVDGSGTGGLRVEGTKARVDTLVTDARLAATTGSGGTLTVAYTDAGNRTIGSAANPAAPGAVSLGLVSNGGTFALGTASGPTGDLGNWAGLVVGQNTTVSFNDNFVFSASADLMMLGGTLALNGTQQSFDSLVVTGTSVIDFGGAASTLNINSLSIADGATLTITNWADSVDYFFAQNDAGATNLGRIIFTPYPAGNTHWQSYDQQITPVPEPTTYGLLLMSAGVGFCLWRRHRTSRVSVKR